MAQVFSEDCNPLSDGYLDQLLRRREFWAIAAYSGEDIIGGITAHVLPMTRAESSEISSMTLPYGLNIREEV
jgi:aminoglycoside 3-N-acetyltransferase I